MGPIKCAAIVNGIDPKHVLHIVYVFIDVTKMGDDLLPQQAIY